MNKWAHWLSFGVLACCSHGSASAAEQITIRACGAFPVLHLRNAETEAAPALHTALRLCGPEEEWQLDSDSPVPGMMLRLRTAKDLRTAQLEVVWPGKDAHRQTLEVDGAERALASAESSDLRVRLAPVPETEVFEVRATNVGAGAVAAALTTAAGWKLEGVEALGDEKVTLQFQQIPVWSVMALLADVAGVQVLREGDKHVRFGKSRDFDAISALLQVTEVAEREAALDRAIKLAAADDEHDLALDTTDLLAEKAGLARDRGDQQQAATVFKQLLDASAKFRGKPEAEVDSSDHARWLTGLAEVQLAAGKRAEARALLDRAQRILVQRQGKHGADIPAVLRIRVGLYDGADSKVVDLLKSAILINEQNGGSISERQVLRTQLCGVLQTQKRWAELDASARLLQAAEARRDFADALIHSSALEWRARAEQGQGNLDHAVELWTELFFSLRDDAGAGAHVLIELARLELQRERWLAASGWWGGMRALRSELFGAEHPLTRAADIELQTLVTLERLNAGIPFSVASASLGVQQLHADALKTRTDVDRIELQHSLLPDVLAEVRAKLDSIGVDDAQVEQRAKLLAGQAELQLALIGQRERSGAAALYRQSVATQEEHAPHAVLTQVLKQRLAELESSP